MAISQFLKTPEWLCILLGELSHTRLDSILITSPQVVSSYLLGHRTDSLPLFCLSSSEIQCKVLLYATVTHKIEYTSYHLSLRQQFEIDSSMKIGYVSLNVSDIQTSLEFSNRYWDLEVLGRPSNNRTLLSSNGNASHLVELLRARDNDPTSRIIKRAGLYLLQYYFLKENILQICL